MNALRRPNARHLPKPGVTFTGNGCDTAATDLTLHIAPINGKNVKIVINERESKGPTMSNSPYRSLPADAPGWKKIVEPAKNAYWEARRDGRDENSALLRALDTAIKSLEAAKEIGNP